MSTTRPTVVLVHGAFVDGSGWQPVHDILIGDGLEVAVTQHSTRSLADDVTEVTQVIESRGGPVLLVGHSYGGVVITEMGTHPQVAGLVYVAAFAPDAGESVATMIADPDPGAPVPPIVPRTDGSLVLDRDRFHEGFAADLPAAEARFLADSQAPWGGAAVGTPVTEPAWRSKPSWYVVATDDRMIPPAAQQGMAARAGATVETVAASHAVYVSQPDAVAGLIRRAAETVSAR
ncbi:alpha/beta hydrolase [Galbitalea sp. SE-J8]|uniref:alpha/beta fold hydrolase n=1 Tax=Galbitalea sp. SE-J8 TaxID=3054952 RepID=UPI00259C91B3|nr:alpha/beta hydrolase [Galbitalea sp. SE-J8]MDM4762811.1 alpha/beta hydrolase [Galbitalea sp. SE-J8]